MNNIYPRHLVENPTPREQRLVDLIIDNFELVREFVRQRNAGIQLPKLNIK